MSKITIRTTADEPTVNTAVHAGPQFLEQVQGLEHLAEHLPEHLAGQTLEEESPRERAKVRPGPRVKTVRRSLGLTQEEFAMRYGIPLGTLRDWEQGRTEPDQPARAYIKVIASNPEWVSRALAAEPQ
jgi:DNA-binding transcriptional regulator YiaG